MKSLLLLIFMFILYSWGCTSLENSFKIFSSGSFIPDLGRDFYIILDSFSQLTLDFLDINTGMHPVVIPFILVLITYVIIKIYDKYTEPEQDVLVEGMAYLMHQNYIRSPEYKEEQRQKKRKKMKRHSEEKTHWLTGEVYTQHFEDGEKVGVSKKEKKWLTGEEYVQHYDSDGNINGRSKDRKNWLTGEEYTQHYDNDGETSGRSKEKSNWLTREEYTQHYDNEGVKTGKSKVGSSMFSRKNKLNHNLDESYDGEHTHPWESEDAEDFSDDYFDVDRDRETRRLFDEVSGLRRKRTNK